MNFRQTATLQGSFGLLVSVVLFLKPGLLLSFIASPGSTSALNLTLVRLLGLFLGGLCVTLLATRKATEVSVQRSVLLSHVGTDLLAAIVVGYLTSAGDLLNPGGTILTTVLLVNAIGYLPCYAKLR
jgi:hypothetical protein